MAWPAWAVYAVIWAVTTVLSIVLAPKPKTPERSAPKPAGIDDFEVPTATPGRDVPVIFGTRWAKGPNVCWFGDLKSTPVRETICGGGGKK